MSSANVQSPSQRHFLQVPLNELRYNLDIKILKADEGNDTGIMHTVNYDSKKKCLMGNNVT